MKNKNKLWIFIILTIVCFVFFAIMVMYTNSNSKISKNTKSKLTYDEKKEIIDDLNEKFEKFRNSDNKYVRISSKYMQTEFFEVNEMMKMKSIAYMTDDRGNVIENKIAHITENIEIDDLMYTYYENRIKNEIERSVTKRDDYSDSFENEAFYDNFISPTKFDLEYLSSEELIKAINSFIDAVDIEIIENDVIFRIYDEEKSFFGHSTTDYKKELTVDYTTGYPKSMSSDLDFCHFEYKINSVTEKEFDISEYKDIEIEK